MPVVGVNRDALFKALGQTYSERGAPMAMWGANWAATFPSAASALASPLSPPSPLPRSRGGV